MHARKNIFGYRMMVWAIVIIGALSFVVWAHHMYVSGMDPYFGFFFATTTLIIAVPTAIKVYNWVLTLWRGDIHLTLPMLFALAFIVTFLNGGLTGLFLGNVVVDVPLSDTMFVVAHFHMVMGVAPIMVIFGAIYHWYPKITGRMLDEAMGQFHFWVTFVGAYAIFFPMHYVGLVGVPRRYVELGDPAFITTPVGGLNAFISVAALIVGFAQMVFLFNIVWSIRHGRPAGGNPWRAASLEWQTPETPPGHGNWGRELPIVYRWAYDYSVPGAPQDFIAQDDPWPQRPRGSRHERDPGLPAGGARLRGLVARAAAADVQALARGRARSRSAGPSRRACRPQKIALGIFLAVVGALFALFASAYFMRMEFADWRPMPMPRIVWLNTGMLVLASVALQCALAADRQRRHRHGAAQPRHRRRGDARPSSPGQLVAWRELAASGYLVTGNPANSFFYLLTGLHGLHILGGLVALARAAPAAWGAGRPGKLRLRLELCVTYWHFLLFVWLGLLVLFTGWATDFVDICRQLLT